MATTWKRWVGVELDEVSAKEKVVAALGGGIAIALLVTITRDALGLEGAPMVIASMGASAVLLFAVPHGQLSQPWPLVGGNLVSAVIGVTAWRVIGPIELAAAVAVGGAILVMHLLKCVHPPGGATALTAVVGSAEVHDLGYGFVLRPVLLNVAVMLAVAIAFNALFAWRRYPAAAMHRPHPPAPAAPSHADVVTALRTLDSFVDIDEDDLLRLVSLLSRDDPRPRDGAR